ncbi:MAG: aminotransferase class I/II-fold pyridoxal phosphate-dependent enzyme, partial [Desulfovibrio sp.]|nr:aminotransferase class I/II-fold pyridoxal phosphate-dependent enzyme [Desulfovibrio sp.]
MFYHDFHEYIDRSGTASSKWDRYPAGILPLWVADTDFKAPQPVIDALARRVAHGVFGYTWEHGSFERSTRAWTGRRYGWSVETAWVHFSPSVVTSLGLAVRALTAPGENVVIQPPVYPPFAAIPRDNGRVPLGNPLFCRKGIWHIDFDDLEKKLAHPRSTLFLLCNPHNPTGRCFTEEELLRMGELCRKHNVRVLSDEIHADFVFTGRHIP